MLDQNSTFGPVSVSRTVRWQWVMLGTVVVLLASLTLWPAIDTLQPVHEVRVAPVLPAQTTQATPVSTAHGVDATQTRTVQAAGWIEPDPYAIAISALADGVVQSIHVLEGETVTTGQIIAELVPDDAKLALKRVEAQVASANARLTNARADLAAAQTNWNKPVERERSVSVTQASLAEAQAELSLLPARVREAKTRLDRLHEEQALVRHAFTSNAATERERLIAEYNTDTQAAILDAIQLEKPLLKARVRRLKAEAEAAERAAALRVEEKQALHSAEAAVANAEAGLAHAKAMLAEAQLRLDRMTIRAPMNGNVLRRLKAPGDKALLSMDNPHSAHLVHLYDPASLQVRVDVPLADASQVYLGQRCEVVVDVLPDETFTGEVTRITHKADLQKNTLQVKVRVVDPSPLLKPEMLARVRFIGGAATATTPTSERDAVVRVPVACLDEQRVWVVRNRRGLRGLAVETPVRVLDSADAFATVDGPLHVGDLLVQAPGGMPPSVRVRIAPDEGGGA